MHSEDYDAEWLYEDYRYYWREFELEQDNGNIARDDQVLSFEAWMALQPADYLAAHGVVNAAKCPSHPGMNRTSRRK